MDRRLRSKRKIFFFFFISFDIFIESRGRRFYMFLSLVFFCYLPMAIILGNNKKKVKT